MLRRFTVLDPRIGYSGLVADCSGDPVALREVEDAKEKLEQFFRNHYCAPLSRPSTPPPSSSATAPSSAFDSPEKVDFTARYETLPIESIDEWEEFLTLKRESFKTCDPIRCWGGRTSRFPRLSKMACDVLSMPGICFVLSFHSFLNSASIGSAVAVERIFSGGRDTISLRRASLKPETIRILMLVKQRLRLDCNAAQRALGGS